MAPGFLSKFIKSGSSTSHSRAHSDASGSSSQSSRKSSSTLPSPNVSQQALSRPATPKIPSSSSHKPPIIKIDASAGASKTSLGTADSGASSQPIVTVIPPSPRSASLSSYSDNIVATTSDRQITDIDSDAGGSGRTISVTASDSDITGTPVPTPTTPSPAFSNLQTSGTRSRPVTPSTPTVPPPPDDSTSSRMPKTLEPKSKEVRRSASSRSLNISTNQTRAAATPETTRDFGQGENGTIVMTPIVESPTALRTEFSSAGQANGGASLVPPRDSDAVSLMSTATNGGTKEKKRPWKKSTTRKPTGLASAIAASGMAMAQPTLSAAQQATFSSAAQQAQSISAPSRKSSIPGSPPYSTRSPPGSSSHVKGRSADFSPASKSKGSSLSKSGARRTSISMASDNASEYYPEDRPEYYSGLDASEDEDESEENESMLDEMEDMPVTGFAVASNKRNADFHELFPSIPEGDYLIEDYGCALQRDILIQGRLYISENHICFHANIFGWITDLSIPMYEITYLEKRMTAFVIPNAIQITTRQAKYTFASFLSRDTTYDVIYNIWRLARPDDGINSSRPSLDGASIGPAPNTVQAATAVATGVLIKAPKVTICACSKDGGHYSESALDCILPGTPERIHNLIFASGFIKDFMSIDQKLLDIQMSDWQPTAPGSNLLTRNMSYIKPLNASVGPKSTKCEIKDEMVYNDAEQYISTVTTTRTPDVPSGGVFSVKTRTCVMWASSVSTRLLVTTQVEWTGRSFIRSIIEKSAIDGQKTYHAELEKSMRKYIQEHQSEFVPEGIDVLPEVATAAAIIGAAATTAGKLSSEEENKRREQERNQRGLQWAWDTFEGASQVAIRSTQDALELIRDAWEQSSSTTIMWFVIVALIISNLWSLILMGSREEAGRRKEMRKMEEREKWVQGVVTSLWDELSKQHQSSVGGSATSNGGSGTKELQSKEGFSWVSNLIGSPSPLAWKKEVGDMQDVLDRMEERVKVMRESLREVREAVAQLDEVD